MGSNPRTACDALNLIACNVATESTYVSAAP